MFRKTLSHCLVPLTFAFTALVSSAQQKNSDIERFDLYGGFTYFSTPDLNLFEHGFHIRPDTT